MPVTNNQKQLKTGHYTNHTIKLGQEKSPIVVFRCQKNWSLIWNFARPIIFGNKNEFIRLNRPKENADV